MDELPDLNSRGDASDNDSVGAAGDRDDRVAALRAAVERGLEDVRAGRVTDLDAAFDRIERMLDEIEAAKRG
ncbi:MAG TPA: hypothetical protein VF605_13730 [Allosphingosinicella sp.]